MKRKKKAGIIILSVFLVLIFLCLGAGIGGYCLFKDEIKAISSFESIDDGLYYFEFEGDYGMDKFLEKGASSDAELEVFLTEFLSKGFYKPKETASAAGEYACSTIAGKSADGDCLFGRNFDWEPCLGVVIKTVPKNGYSSVCTANLDFLGFGEGFIPDSVMNKMFALAAVYVPLDGMNEKGLCVADLIIRVDERTNQDTEKVDITTTTAIRLLLDRAANVDEAIELLKKYDMHSSADMMHHFSISDANGKSVVVEYVKDEMIVTETEVVTNFYLTEKAPDRAMTENNTGRFDTLTATYGRRCGKFEETDILEALASVEDDTEWSIVYNKNRLTAEFYHRGVFEKSVRKFSLRD